MNYRKTIKSMANIVGLWYLLSLPIAGNATVDIGLSQSLHEALEAQGWQAEKAADGSLIYRRPSGPVKADELPQPEMRTLGGEDLNRAMEERGWQIQWSPDGSLLLRQKKDSPSRLNEPDKGMTPEAESHPTVQIPEQSGFEYWRIERQDDGSLHFHPLGQVTGAETQAAQVTSLALCEGIEIRNSAVSLPVDQWSEARRLSEGWLNDSGLDDTQVGKIRRILGVYLVSLVENSPPFRLKHQLVIRVSDGRVMLVD